MEIKIGKKIINKNNPCFIVAEISANHGGSFKKACDLIKKAKLAGADAVKLQTYKPETITLNSKRKDFLIRSKSPWKKKKTLWNLYDEAQTPWEWHPKLFLLAKKLKIEIFSSPFDETAVNFLEKLNCPAYKIASPEINHIPLIEKVAKTGKPIILSTGLSNEEDLRLAIKTIKKNKNNKIAILKCTSSYPATAEELNLSTIPNISKKYKCISGFSDHTVGNVAAFTSVALGGKILEKHFMIKDIKSVDDFFSMGFHEFKFMIEGIRYLEKAKGKISYQPSVNAKRDHFWGRRSIYVCKKIKKDELVSKSNVRIVRPNHGLHPKNYYNIIGKKVNKTLLPGIKFKKEYIKK